MTHPDISQALATAHREDLLRAASAWTGRVRRTRSHRISSWLEAQLRRLRPAALPPVRPACGMSR